MQMLQSLSQTHAKKAPTSTLAQESARKASKTNTLPSVPPRGTLESLFYAGTYRTSKVLGRLHPWMPNMMLVTSPVPESRL